MSEPTPGTPDLLDSAGRLRRIAAAVLVGAAVATLTYFIANVLVEPDAQPKSVYVNRNMQASTFVWWVSAVAGGCALVIALVIGNRLAKRAWERERIPIAKVR